MTLRVYHIYFKPLFLYSLLQTLGSFLFCSSATQLAPCNYISTDNYLPTHMTSMSVQTQEGRHTHKHQGGTARAINEAIHHVIIWFLVTAIHFPESLKKTSRWMRCKK